MIQTIKENKKGAGYAALAILSEIIRNNPSLISFLPQPFQSYVLGAASLFFAYLTIANTQATKPPAQVEKELIQKEQEKQETKTEIRQETAALVQEAKDLVDSKVAEIKESIPAIVATVVPEIVTIKKD